MPSPLGSPALATGDTAPDFTLDSTTGTPVRLASVLESGAALIAFFPLAFTSTCTAEVCDLSADFDSFTGADVRVLPVSVDSVPTLREFQKSHGIRVPLLSDFRREVSRRYGVLLEDRFYSARAYFLVDRTGVIRWMHVEENPGERRTNAEIFAAIEQLGMAAGGPAAPRAESPHGR